MASHLDMRVYCAWRRCKAYDSFSGPRRAARTIGAGCGHAGAVLRTYTLRILDAICNRVPGAIPRNIVDDMSLQCCGARACVADSLRKSAGLLVEGLRYLELPVQESKSGLVTADDSLGRLLSGNWQGASQFP